MRVVVFGDSITNGFYDSKGGWADRLKQYYLEKIIAENSPEYPNVFNLGISGDTAHGLLKRIHSEAKARLWPGEENAYIIAIGTNDTIYRGEEADSTPEQYREVLANLLDQAKKFTSKVLFVSLFPVVDALLQPMPWSATGKCYSTERMKLFNDALVDFCQEQNLPIVDLWTVFEDEGVEGLLYDGIHPNEDGHRLIYEAVKPRLEELIK